MPLSGTSTAAGTQFVVMAVPRWPPRQPELVREMQLSDGRLLIWAQPEARVTAELHFEHDEYIHPPARAPTCVLRANGPAFLLIIVRWRDRKIADIRINGHCCFNADGEEAVSELLLPPPNSDPTCDYGTENEKARLDRSGRAGGAHPKPGRTPGGRRYAIEALKDEVAQIADLIDQIHAGKEYHIPGLSARLRLLVYGKPCGLLQTAAAHFKLPLILYTDERLGVGPPPFAPDLGLIFNGSPARTFLSNNAVDLDVWLRFPALTIRDKVYTNLDVIRDIGDTIGSHRDPDITPAVQAMMRRPSLSGQRYNDVARYILAVADVVVALSGHVIEAAEKAI